MSEWVSEQGQGRFVQGSCKCAPSFGTLDLRHLSGGQGLMKYLLGSLYFRGITLVSLTLILLALRL